MADVLRICTLAHRQGMGDFVWLGWNCRRGGPSWLSNGSTAIAVSRTGAAALKEALDAGKIELSLIHI